MKEWSDIHKVNVILTSGGTGFAPRDVTPEATKKVIDKAAPGITFALFKASYDITPMAMLSRYKVNIFSMIIFYLITTNTFI